MSNCHKCGEKMRYFSPRLKVCDYCNAAEEQELKKIDKEIYEILKDQREWEEREVKHDFKL